MDIKLEKVNVIVVGVIPHFGKSEEQVKCEKVSRSREAMCQEKNHKHIASMDTESLNRLGVVKCAIAKMELALTYLNALTDKNQDSQRVAWHEYLKRAISPEMAMEVRTISSFNLLI